MSGTSTTDDALVAQLSGADRQHLRNCGMLGGLYLPKEDAERLAGLELVTAAVLPEPRPDELAANYVYINLGPGCAHVSLTPKGQRIRRAIEELGDAERAVHRRAR